MNEKSNSIDNNDVYRNSTHKNKLMSVNSSGKKHIKLMRRLLLLQFHEHFGCPSCCEVVSEFYTEQQSTLL